MQLITNITDALQINNYCERELKNIHHYTNVASPKHIRDYGTMSKALLRLRNHGILIRFKRRNQDTGRKNWYYALNVNDAQLAAYLEKKQKQFDHYVAKYRAKQAEFAAKHKPVDAIRSMASLPSDPLAKVYAMTTDERIKAFIEEARPDLKPAPVEPHGTESVGYYIAVNDWQPAELICKWIEEKGYMHDFAGDAVEGSAYYFVDGIWKCATTKEAVSSGCREMSLQYFILSPDTVREKTKEQSDYFEFEPAHTLNYSFDNGPLVVANGLSPEGMKHRCLAVSDKYDVELIDHHGFKLIAFKKK